MQISNKDIERLTPIWQSLLAGLAATTGAFRLTLTSTDPARLLAHYPAEGGLPPTSAAPEMRLAVSDPQDKVVAWLEIFAEPQRPLTPGAQAIAEAVRGAVQDQLVQALNGASPTVTAATDSLDEESALETAPDKVVLFDQAGHVFAGSQNSPEIVGHSVGDDIELSGPEFAITLNRQDYDALRPGQSAKRRMQARRPDGSRFPCETQISCQLVDQRKIYVCLIRDLSEEVAASGRRAALNSRRDRHVAERTVALNTTSRQLQAIMDTLPDGITLTDADATLLHANPAARTLLGIGAGELGKRLTGRRLEALSSGEPVTVKEKRLDSEGRERTLLITHSPRRDENGAIDGLVSVYRDISEAELAERRVRHSVDSLERAEKLARIGSWTLDLQTGAFGTSPMMYELNGVPPDREITIDDLARMMPEDDFARLGAAIGHCASSGAPYTVDVTHYIPGGGAFQAEIRGRAMREDDGTIFAITGTVQDVSARIAAQEQLSAIADSLPNGAIYRIEFLDADLGTEGRGLSHDTMQFSYISAGIHKLLGMSAEDLIADPGKLISAIHPDDIEGFFAASRAASANHENFEFDFRLTRPDGALIWLQVRSAPRIVAGRRVWDGIILDVSAAYEAAEALRRAKEGAEAAERAKSGFLATMSHEIRTPMNSVIGMARLALQTDLSPRQRNYLDKIDASARALLGLINDILDFSRIEAGGLQLETTEFALDSVLETVSNATSLRAEEKGLEVVYAVAPEVPWLLRGDPLRLGQVLINLVGNAIKFTDRGEVKVSIAPTADETHLRFEVRDTGIGMDAAQQAELFRPFSQTTSRTARHYGGTGLGLSISKQLVLLMGGQIDVTSQPNFGSCFSFVVPLVDPVARNQRRSNVFQGRRALVVDDSASARTALSEMVQSLGFECQAVASGREALERLRQQALDDAPVDLVLMDWRMPEMDGVEAARQIRADRVLRRLPAVLMVTAHARDEVVRHVDELDLQGLLIKPVTESMMLDAVQQVFARRGVGLSPPPGTIPDMEIPPILRGKSVLVVDDNQFNLEVASDFLELAGMQVRTAVSGQGALDCLAQHQFDLVLMDMQMPVMDGLETTRRIRLDPALRDLPVVALTAQARLEDREATQQVGMTDHLTKPIDENLMFATLARILSQTTPPPQPRPEAPNSNSSSIDLAHMLGRMRGDHGRVMRTLEMFLRDFAICPEETRTALATGNRGAVAAVAHRVRGTAGYLGASKLKALGDELEHLARAEDLPAIDATAAEFLTELEAVLAACRAARDGQPS